MSRVAGRVLFAVPRIGYLRDFIKTLLGLALLILIPSGLLLGNEVLSLSRESNPRYKALTRRRRRVARR